MTFGTYIRERRHALNLTLREASLRSGISSTDWSKMERDINTAPKDTNRLTSLATSLNITISLDGTFRRLATESWQTPAPAITELDIDDHMPLFHPLTPEQQEAMRPLIRETLTRNSDF